MSRKARVWWHDQKQAWCTELGGSRRILAKGRRGRREAEKKLVALQKEQELIASVGGAVSVARLCDEFLADAQEHLEPATYDSYRHACQKFVDLFGSRLAHTIEPLDVQRFSVSLKKSLGDTSRAIVLRALQRCFDWAVEHRLIPPHQLGRIRKPRARVRDRYVSDAEFRLLLRATNSLRGKNDGASFRRLLMALDWTLCRPGELARLQWVHVHLENDVAILPDHKTKRTGRPKIIPLVPKMKRLLRWLQKNQQSDFCFVNSSGRPWTRGAMGKRMEHVRERSGLAGVLPYSIRHRAATNSVLRTGDLKMTSMLLGHTSTATTERYTHLAQEHLVAFARRAIG